MIDTKFLDQLGRFHLIVHKRVTSNYAGEKRSIAEGRGIVFKDHRIYAPGDDIRSIDWKVFARTDDLYVRRYEEERNMVVHVIVDSSASMNYGKKITKFDYASMIGVGFAYLAMKENQKFEFSTFADSLNISSPKKGMHQLASTVSYINTLKPAGMSRLGDAIIRYKRTIRSRSLIVLVSDFLFPIEEIRDALFMLGNHDIKVVQVLDKSEEELKLSGDFKLHDSETRSILKTLISPRLRMNYQHKMEDHMTNIGKICDKLDIDFFTITTDTPIFDAFYRILE